MSIEIVAAMKPGPDIVDESARIIRMENEYGVTWYAKVPDFAAAEIERLQRRSDALQDDDVREAIRVLAFEMPLHVPASLSPRDQAALNKVQTWLALTAIAATTAPQGEVTNGC